MQTGILLVLLLFIISAQGEDTGLQHLKLNTMKNIAACKKEHNARREDYDAIRKSESPSSEEGQCFLACLFSKFQVMENSKFSAESFRKLVAELYEDESDKLQKAKQMVNECETTLSGQNESSKCRYAVKVLECIASYTSRVEVIKDLLKYQKIKRS